jgi:hypothetical protein
MNINSLWHVTPRSLVDRHQQNALFASSFKMEETRSSETLAHIY